MQMLRWHAYWTLDKGKLPLMDGYEVWVTLMVELDMNNQYVFGLKNLEEENFYKMVEMS